MTQQLFKTFLEQHLETEFGKGVQTGKHTQLSVRNDGTVYVLYILENNRRSFESMSHEKVKLSNSGYDFFFKGCGCMGQSSCKTNHYWFSRVTFEVSKKILARKPHLVCSSRKQKIKEVAISYY